LANLPPKELRIRMNDGKGSIHIRPYRRSDLSDVLGLMNALGYPTQLDKLETRMERMEKLPHYCTYMAELDHEVAGMMGLRIVYAYELEEPVAQISLLVTSQKHRGQGVGKALVAFAERWAVQSGACSLMLTSGIKPEREAAHRFYSHAGFAVNGYRFVKKV